MKKTFETAEYIIHYRKIGEGQPVVLLHGFGEDSHIWDAQIDALQHICCLFVPDLLGTGESKWKNENVQNPTLSIEYLASTIAALLAAENGTNCIVLGHSMGGYITLALAEKQPQLLKAFGLIHSTAFADSEAKKETRQKSIAFMQANGAMAFLKTSIPGLYASAFREANPLKIEAHLQAAANCSLVSLIGYTESMRDRPDRTIVLANAQKPVLFVMGTEDIAAPLNDVLKQCYLPRVSYIHILANVGHLGMVEEPKKMNAILQNFIMQFE
jgi:pimeloyl-ACP methyl ester carboxylesterase